MTMRLTHPHARLSQWIRFPSVMVVSAWLLVILESSGVDNKILLFRSQKTILLTMTIRQVSDDKFDVFLAPQKQVVLTSDQIIKTIFISR